MFQISTFMLKQMYVSGSLCNTDTGIRFKVQNPFLDGTITAVLKVAINGTAYDLTQIRAAGWGAETVTAEAPVNFPRGADLEVDIVAEQLPSGRHNLYFKVQTAEFGPLKVEVYDRI